MGLAFMIGVILLIALASSGVYMLAKRPRREPTMAERAEAARWAAICDLSEKTHP